MKKENNKLNLKVLLHKLINKTNSWHMQMDKPARRKIKILIILVTSVP